MKVKDLMNDIKKECYWVNYDCTRDHILVGNEDNEIHSIGVCWVATMKTLKQAKELGIDFIVSHENIFYVEGTHIYEGYYQAKKEKEKFCKDNNITVVRLHDSWDKLPEYGIADRLAKAINLPFEKREVINFNQILHVNNKMTISEIAKYVATGLKNYGCDHVDVLGNKDQLVNNFVIGVGAATDLPSMIKLGADAVMLADDGSNNWVEQQYCLDKNIPVILVHHSTNEMPGIDGMKEYFENKYNINVTRLSEGYEYTLIK